MVTNTTRRTPCISDDAAVVVGLIVVVVKSNQSTIIAVLTCAVTRTHLLIDGRTVHRRSYTYIVTA
jgi:hypothetical protein